MCGVWRPVATRKRLGQIPRIGRDRAGQRPGTLTLRTMPCSRPIFRRIGACVHTRCRAGAGEALMTRTALVAHSDDPGPLLVGREPERRVLRRRLTAALAGRGALALISGAA